MIRLAALLTALLVSGPLTAVSSSDAGRRSTFTLARTRQAVDGYTPAQIATAYAFRPLYDAGITGAGQTVALIELDQYNPADMATFDARYGLPPVTVSEVYVGQKPYTLERRGETNFDVEWLHALAPGAAIRLYYLNPAEPIWKQFTRAFTRAAADGATTISVSIGTCARDQGYTMLKRRLASLLKRNISIFAASGDYGDKPGPKARCGAKPGVTLPAADPSVVAVGGTSLRLNRDNSIRTEVAWRLSGGGKVAGLTRFPWQRAPTMPSGTRRWAPDVAFLGDVRTGVNFVYNGAWAEMGGTSLGAPAWAAAWTLVRQYTLSTGKTLEAAPRLLYRIGNSSLYSSDFHDIVRGSNGRYRAGPGWDPVTGWGSPDVGGIAATIKGWAEAP